jgi:hypothetical protein
MLMAGVVVAVLLSAPVPQNSPQPQRIVAASNVRLRAEPQTAAEEVTRLPLGTVLTQLETSADGAWFRVQTPDGKLGWVFGNLTESFSERERVAVYRRIIQSRLRPASISFPDASDLFQFVDRVAPQVQSPVRAEFDLFRLRALHRSLDQIMGYEPKDPAHRDWIKSHEDDLVYSEPAGQWLVRADLYWELEMRDHGNPIADEIAWEAANTGIPGECEGYIPCYFAVFLLSDARYLDLYPSGRHGEEAGEHIDYLLQEVLKPNNPYTMDSRDSGELHESIVKLSTILERSSIPKKTAMLTRLKRIEETYR